MKIIIFGLGSIGKRHARILSEHFGHELFAFRSRRGSAANTVGIEEVRDWKGIERLKPDAAFITNPTSMHVDTALRCSRLGMHLFIEKPVSNTMKGMRNLGAICRRKGLTCYTAYCLRFHPVVKKMRELLKNKKIYHARVVCSSYLPDWRPGQPLKESYAVFAGKGGGALLELSHEFDYIQYLFGRIASVKGSAARRSSVTVDAEDCADVLLGMENGVRVNLHVNFLSRFSERTIKVDFDGGYIIGDLVGGRIDYLCQGTKRVFKFKIDRDAYLKEQARYFFDNIGNPCIMNGLEESRGLLGKILEIRRGR